MSAGYRSSTFGVIYENNGLSLQFLNVLNCSCLRILIEEILLADGIRKLDVLMV